MGAARFAYIKRAAPPQTLLLRMNFEAIIVQKDLPR